jgi:hypothetical protein
MYLVYSHLMNIYLQIYLFLMYMFVVYLLYMKHCLLVYVVAMILINACGYFVLFFGLNVVKI